MLDGVEWWVGVPYKSGQASSPTSHVTSATAYMLTLIREVGMGGPSVAVLAWISIRMQMVIFAWAL